MRFFNRWCFVQDWGGVFGIAVLSTGMINVGGRMIYFYFYWCLFKERVACGVVLLHDVPFIAIWPMR